MDLISLASGKSAKEFILGWTEPVFLIVKGTCLFRPKSSGGFMTVIASKDTDYSILNTKKKK